MATAVETMTITKEDDFDHLSDAASTVALEGAVAEELSANPIGELQELCVSKGWALPAYEDGPRTGPPHFPTFVIDCRVNKLVVSKSATSKKEAKKQAAAGMLGKIKRGSFSEETQPSAPQELADMENVLNKLKLGDELKPTQSRVPLEEMSAIDLEDHLRTLAKSLSVDFTCGGESAIKGRSVFICELDGSTITGYGTTPREARLDAGRAVLHKLRVKASEQ